MVLVILNVVAIINLLFVAVLLLIRRPHTRTNGLLAFIILDPVAAMILLLMIYYKVADSHPAIFYVSYLLDFSWAPLFYYYIRLMLHHEIKCTVKTLLHFCLLILGSLFFMWFALQPQAYRAAVLSQALTENYPWQFYILDYLTVLQTAIYLPVCYRIIKKHNRHVEQVFSNTETISARWMQEFIIIGGIAAILMYFPLITNAKLIFPLLFVPLTSLGLYCYLVYKAISSPLVFGRETLEIIKQTKDVTTNEKKQMIMDDEPFSQLTTILEIQFVKDKWFLDPELNIQKLSVFCKTKVYILSAYINKQYNKNFCDYINYYRIEEAKELLSNPEHQKYSIDTIAQKSGFTSRSSFYKAFKKDTGLTPGEYIKTKMGTM